MHVVGHKTIVVNCDTVASSVFSEEIPIRQKISFGLKNLLTIIAAGSHVTTTAFPD